MIQRVEAINTMLLFIFVGFLIGFALSLRFLRRPTKALVWGLILGGVPLTLLFGPGNTPVQGIGSALNFAFFALGPIMLVLFMVIGAALGVAGASAALWIGLARAKWAGWTAGIAVVGMVAVLTLLPVSQR